MAQVVVVATAGAGGDLQPLVASALALERRGHDVTYVGDGSVARSLAPLGIDVSALPAELDLGPRLGAIIKEAMAASGGDQSVAGPMVQKGLTHWAGETAVEVGKVLNGLHPDAVVTSLFGVEVLDAVAPSYPWAVINSTFYVGPGAPRPLREDFAPRAVPLVENFVALLDSASLVLHATDQVFDYGFDRLPPTHRYVGPTGIWEFSQQVPSYIDEPGDPWVLVSISSQMQDDVPIAEAAITALADRPVRVLVTVGPGHDPGEIVAAPANAFVEQTVPHSALLERGVLLVAHAGHGSVMKALWHGRPMVLVPWGRDQPGVAARAHHLGVARVVPREHASPDSLRDAIADVLSDPTFSERAASHGARLRTTSPADVAAEALESIL